MMRADSATYAEIVALHDAFCSGFARQDADGVAGLFAADEDVVMVTSEEALLRGPAEIRAFLERYARGSTVYSWVWDRRSASADRDIGWLLAEGSETAASPAGAHANPYRMSLVCERRAGRWLLQQIHGSSPHVT